MEHNAPLVSIVCDTYNHAPYVRAALDSFLMQKTEFPFEIIVHDDASTDGTADIIREYEAAHPDLFRCVYRTENIYRKDPKILEHYVFPLARGSTLPSAKGTTTGHRRTNCKNRLSIWKQTPTARSASAGRTP